jgi:adenosylcobinamide kinase/adenosylcobinamide-phosphate guanylyltransferase
MRIFISGGCKNGKSYYAQRLSQAQACSGKAQAYSGTLYYIATMRPCDAEDAERIARHRRERYGWGFTTIEQPVRIENILHHCDHSGSFLLDSLTALLSNEMFPANSPKGAGCPHERAEQEVVAQVKKGVLTLLRTLDNIVLVSDYIYSDAWSYDPITEAYRKALAEIDCAAAQGCDVVLEVAYTHVIVHKGKEVFDTLHAKL